VAPVPNSALPCVSTPNQAAVAGVNRTNRLGRVVAVEGLPALGRGSVIVTVALNGNTLTTVALAK
jgi:hypothetical protein